LNKLKKILNNDTLNKDAVKGSVAFFNDFERLKKNNDSSRIFNKNLNAVNQFLNVISKTSGVLAMFNKNNFGLYYNCQEHAISKNNDMLWKGILRENMEFKSSYACINSPERVLLQLVDNKNMFGSIKQYWNELIKKGFIEKNWNEVNWLKVGRSAGGILNKVIRPVCRRAIKRHTMKKMEEKLFKS